MSDDDNTERGPVSPEKAMQQAAEFLSVFAGYEFDLGDGQKWTLPNPHFLPPVMKRRFLEHMRFMAKGLDQETVTHPVTNKRAKQRVWPPEYKGKLINEDELLCIALMAASDDGVAERDAYFASGALAPTYERFLAAGGVPGQIDVQWSVMNLQMEERRRRDSKSS